MIPQAQWEKGQADILAGMEEVRAAIEGLSFSLQKLAGQELSSDQMHLLVDASNFAHSMTLHNTTRLAKITRTLLDKRGEARS